MITYRRRKTSDTWHFMPACSLWPIFPLARKFVEQAKKPTNGEFCNQCLAKKRRLRG